MKKLILVITVLFSISSGVKAQDSFYDAILKFDGVEFQERYHVSAIPEKEGYYKPGGEGRTITFKVKQTKKGNYCAVTAFEKDGDSRGFVITDQITDYNTFSYAYPGIVVHKYTKKGYVFLDDMLIMLEGVSRDGLSYGNIGRIYWVKLTDEEKAAAISAKEEAKKKMTMKEKLAAAKDFATNGAKGSVRYEKFINTNLDELIKSYLKTMNEKHLADKSGKEASIKADVKMERESFLKDRQKDSREYAAKLNAQKDGGASSYTIKNTSGAPIKIINDSFSTRTLSAGESTTYFCNVDLFFCVGESEKGSLICDGDEVCGTTVNL